MTFRSTIQMVTLCGFAATLAQPAETLKFEVASIKPADPGAGGHSSLNSSAGGGLRATNNSLKQLITFAYGVQDFQISGGPGWLDSARYDILAKPDHEEGPAEVQATDAQLKTQSERIRERLRALLAERFQLTIHRETKEFPVYALVVAKSGPKLEESTEPDGAKQSTNTNSSNGKAEMTARRVPMQSLAHVLSSQLSRPVLDRTGLTGKYNFKMRWTADMSARGAGNPGEANLADSSGPSIFTAIQEQLGLRLESTKGPVEVLVIDHVEKPSEN